MNVTIYTCAGNPALYTDESGQTRNVGIAYHLVTWTQAEGVRRLGDYEHIVYNAQIPQPNQAPDAARVAAEQHAATLPCEGRHLEQVYIPAALASQIRNAGYTATAEAGWAVGYEEVAYPRETTMISATVPEAKPLLDAVLATVDHEGWEIVHIGGLGLVWAVYTADGERLAAGVTLDDAVREAVEVARSGERLVTGVTPDDTASKDAARSA